MKLRKKTALIDDSLAGLPDEVIHKIAFAMPLSGGAPLVDEDGFDVSSTSSVLGAESLKNLQQVCFDKYISNPQISSSVRDTSGAVAGSGFGVSSDVKELKSVIKSVMLDPRNMVQRNAKKWVSRREIEGELFLCLTVHDDGFVEIDFVDPKTIGNPTTGGSNEKTSGILFHPDKSDFPLAYFVEKKDSLGIIKHLLIPSINIALYPDLASIMKKMPEYSEERVKDSRASGSKYSGIGGFKRFIVSWNSGLFTARNVGHLRSTLVWINLYEQLKKYEIDHKKSSGAYLWVSKFADLRSFQIWLSLSDEDREKTGLMKKKTPGSTLILPPGMDLEVKNPTLPKISDQDTDILQMITSGLNKPEDQITGQSKGTFASVKASRGPQTDRIENDKAEFALFLQYDLFRAVFFLKSSVDPTFKNTYKVKTAVSFDENREPVFEDVEFEAHELISINMPNTALADAEALARALLGVKHGSLADTLGIPLELLAKKLGFANYKDLRLAYATEKETLPDVQTTIDAETAQEQALAKSDATQAGASAKSAKAEEGKTPAKVKKPIPKKSK